MSKPYFFISQKNTNKNSVRITGDDVGHIRKVLRLHKGDKVFCCDEKNVMEVELVRLEKTEIEGSIKRKKIIMRPSNRIGIFPGLLKGKKFDTVLRMATELGVDAIYPVEFKRNVKKKDKKKKERWEKIIIEAAKQSKRTYLPVISLSLTFKEFIMELQEFQKIIVFWENAIGKDIKNYIGKNEESIAVIIGPEGGLEKREVDEIVKKGGVAVSLGENTLRAETAIIAALSLVMYESGRFERNSADWR